MPSNTATRLGLAFQLLFASVIASSAAEVIEADVCIYGGTVAGVAAGVQVSRMGKKAVIAEFGNHLGGMTSGGLGATDIGNKSAIGGISLEFYHRVALHYSEDASWHLEDREAYFKSRYSRPKAPDLKGPDATMWTFEPHVAETILFQMLNDARVPLYFQQRLQSVRMENGRIVEIQMENGKIYRSKMFIDATYEGDLMARARVTYTVGREANSQYHETLNGIRDKTPKHQLLAPVVPYIKTNEPGSGLIPLIQPIEPGLPGGADKSVQAYNFRLCYTRTPANRLPNVAP